MAILYVVGIGGTGSKIVIEFAKQMSSLKKEIESRDLPAFFKVQIFDLAREPEVDEAVRNRILSDEDVHIIPGAMVEARKYSIQQLASEKPWFPRSLVPEIPITLRGERGVERRRPLARIVIHDADVSSAIYSELSRDLDDLISAATVKGVGTIVAVIVASLGGGFGSGTLHDIAALLRKAFEEKTKERGLTLYIFGVFLLPHGYGVNPPPGIRSPFEEENSFAVLRELAILEALSERGEPYTEKIGRIEELSYSKHYDGVFLVSYAGVPGYNYEEKFREVDSRIAEFIRLLALLPGTMEESGQTVAGIAISENILKYKHDLENKFGRAPAQYRPIFMSFNVASASLGFSRLADYFEMLRELEEVEEKIGELEKTRAELEAKKKELGEKAASLEHSLRDCEYRWNRAIRDLSLSMLEESVRRRVEELAKSISSAIASNPYDYSSSDKIEALIDSKLGGRGLNRAIQYLVLELIASELSSVLDRLNAEYGEKVEELRKNNRLLDDLRSQRSSLPLLDKVFRSQRYRELNEQVELLEKRVSQLEGEVADLKRKRGVLETALRVIRERASAVKPESSKEMCRSIEDEYNMVSGELSEVSKRLEQVVDKLEEQRSKARKLEREIELMERKDKLLTNYRHMLGVEFLRKTLYEEWKNNPDRFVNMTITQILDRLDEPTARKVANYLAGELRVTGPMLDAELRGRTKFVRELPQRTYAACIGRVVRELYLGDDDREVIENGTTIVIGHPDDLENKAVRDAIARNIPSYTTLPLESVRGELKLIRIYPVVIPHCTAEYQKFLEEYCYAKRQQGLYEMLHVIEVDRLAEKLGADRLDPYLVDHKCDEIVSLRERR